MSLFLKLGKKIFLCAWKGTKKWRLSRLFSLLITQGCLLMHAVASTEGSNAVEMIQFLNLLASAEADDWQQLTDELNHKFPSLVAESSMATSLSRLKQKILESGDLELIKLYNRAVRNHDALSIEKAEPVPKYYKHYESPDFFVTDIHLIIDVRDSSVFVTSDLTIKHHHQKNVLILDGEEHKVHQVSINGKPISKEQYKVTPCELILYDIPDEETFQVVIQSEINPFINDSLEGMYRCCGQWLTTQCESEGARRIFFTLDRPDVLSRMTTTIIADKELYPYRLSNGDLINEEIQEDGRWAITWHDPFPKPSYLFACVLGRFSLLTSHFKTRGGKDVELQVYVESGKESRAHYSLYVLKKAMEFDEASFDREYDLSCLKMVGIPDFNSGAMENKGLMIFNDVRLLVDPLSGTDTSYREIAHIVAHEYFHNWSGNRVTVRNWFEIALKEAFTDLRAMLFSEWLFGSEFIRPKAIQALKENQFPEELSEKGHPIIVESYVDAHSIYDHTTYIKGREIFRMLKNTLDMLIPEGFREVQNLYFSRYDGQAVSFRELLKAGNDVLKNIGKDLSKFERWFHQPGTPVIDVDMKYDAHEKEAHLKVRQSCPHPRTGQEQEPFQVPFSLELLGEEGEILYPKFSCILEDEKKAFLLLCLERPTPVFMHGYSAPVILHYDYTLKDLACIAKYSDDPFCRWEAAQNYSVLAIKEMKARIDANNTLKIQGDKEELSFVDLYQLYIQALESPRLSPLAKAQILRIPTLRTLSQSFDDYDFEKLGQLRSFFIQQLAHFCKPLLEQLLEEYPAPVVYEPVSEQMQIRELRYIILNLLVDDEKYQEKILEQYRSATNFDDVVSAFNLCLKIGDSYRDFVTADFYEKWKEDKAVFNVWLSSQALFSKSSLEELCKLESVKGYDGKNPNHVRSLFRTLIANLECYHSSNGDAYEYIVDKVLEIASFNPFLAHNHIAVPAFMDFEKLPNKQKILMAKALERLKKGVIPSQTRDLIEKMLERHYGVNK